MSENNSKTKFRKIIGIVGYVLGIIIFLISIVNIITDFKNWSSYAILATMGLIVAYLADIVNSSNDKTELLLRIMKRQENLFRLVNKLNNDTPPFNPLSLLKDIMGSSNENNDNPNVSAIKVNFDENGEMKIEGDGAPKEIFEVLQKITSAVKDSIEKDTGKPIENMSIEELQKELDKCILQEDYKKAGVIRDELNKRESLN
jgi:cysteinyl-tRNA synthetase